MSEEMTQQMMAQQQLAQMRQRALPPGVPGQPGPGMNNPTGYL